jgi:formate hydrogenlyase subunit 4
VIAIRAAVDLALVIGLAPLFAGIVVRTKAICAGRRGPPIRQAYFDLARLLRKGAVYSRTTTWIFRASPVVVLAATLAAAWVFPIRSGEAAFAFEGDLVLFAYLLGLARFFTMSAALDTGSSFEGMGASREAAFSALAEPAVLLSLAVLAVHTHAISFVDAFETLAVAPPESGRVALWLACAGFAVALLAENSRIPVDDPTTHLELTMVHEVMVLDHGGPDLALLLEASMIKLLLFAAVFVRLAMPAASRPGPVGGAAFLAGLLGVAALLGLLESVVARLRLPRVPQFLVSASVLSGLAFAVHWAAEVR